MSADLSGNVTDRFETYSWELNRDLIHHAYKETNFLRGISDDTIEWRAKYPDGLTSCKQ